MTFTAAVTSPAGAPTGSVTFTSDGTALGTVELSSGQAALTTSELSGGDHTIAATYNGNTNANFEGSNATLTQTVSMVRVQGVTDPELAPLMSALSDVIRDSNGDKIIILDPPCATTSPYQGLSNIDKLNQSAQTNDGCLQFVSSTDGPS